jgi:hypothetical protein
MADVISTCSENDTSGNTSGGGQWYTTLSSWEAAAQTRFGTTPNREIVECYNDFAAGHLADVVTLSGWAATTSTDYPYIKAAAGHEHNGVVDAGFTIEGATNVIFVSLGVSSHCEIEDIQINCNRAVGSNGVAFNLNAESKAFLSRCILQRTAGTVLNRSVAHIGTNGSVATFTNCLFIGGAYAIAELSTSQEVYANNCTMVDFAISAISADTGTVDCTNVVAYSGAGGTVFPAVGTYTNCASTDGSQGTTVVDSTAFVDYQQHGTVGDYTPVGGSPLDGAGADLSGTFTDDIAGNTRSVPWEIGAYEIAAAGGVTFDGPNIIDQPQGVENEVFVFDENGEGTVASRFSVT